MLRARTVSKRLSLHFSRAELVPERVLVLEPSAPDKKQLTTLLKQLKPLIGITTVNGSSGSP